MSALQRIEETYLGILRFVIILASSILLIAAVILGLSALGGLKGEGAHDKVDTSVKPDEVLSKVAAEAPPAQAASPRAKSSADKSKGLASDPNQAFYDRTAAAVVKFVEKYAKGVESVEPQNVVEVSRKKAESFNDPALTTAYAAGLADVMEKALTDPALAKRIEKPAKQAPAPAPQGEEDGQPGFPAVEPPFKESPLQIVNQLLASYTQLFIEKQEKKQELKARAEAEEMERKATSMTQLYLAGGAFASFLFLVFISIVVKIERNLRQLTPAVPAPAKPSQDRPSPRVSRG